MAGSQAPTRAPRRESAKTATLQETSSDRPDGSDPPRPTDMLLLLGLALQATLHTNEQWVLRARPSGDFRASDLALQTVQEDDTALAEGEVLVEVETLSIEAFYRTTLDEEAYHGSTALGGVVPALGLGKVVASNSRKVSVSRQLFTQTLLRRSAQPAR